MKKNPHLYSVILAGGGGTRLWPKSRNANPKQFLKLTGDKTMLQLTADRITKIVDWDHIIVVTNKLYLDEVKKELPQVPPDQILAEPEKRETALAMLVGSLYAKSLDPDAVVINKASDHIVLDEKEFSKVMSASVTIAQKKENIVAVGITPTFPNTGFGYVKIGEKISQFKSGLPLFKVESFTEKPDEKTAKKYIKTGKYYWNANMYVWACQTIDEAFEKYMPQMHQLTRVLEGKTGSTFHKQLKKIYQKAETISIDYAISEKAQNLVLIPGDFGWDDVVNWSVVADLNTSNGDGNVVIGDGQKVPTLAIESTNNLIHAEKKLVAIVGINEMVVVDTDDILMILPKKRSQDVKKIVNQLKEKGKKEYL